MKSIFVSHVYEDQEYLNKIKGWEKKGLLSGYTITSEIKDYRIKGEAQVKNYLRDKIRGSAIVLVLIGDNTHNHQWITWKVEVANNLHKNICCMRIPETSGSLPEILKKYPELSFHANQITKEFNL